MARDPQAALVALNRFGFGARGGASGDFVNAASDPRGFVRAELERPALALLEAPTLQPTPALAEDLFTFQREQKEKREAAAKVAAGAPSAGSPDQKSGPMDAAPPAMAAEPRPGENAPPLATMQPGKPRPPKPAPNVIQQTYRAEALARIQRATLVECGFVERLVTFWSNHFCISANKGQPARIWAGAFEREAIRPHVRPQLPRRPAQQARTQ